MTDLAGLLVRLARINRTPIIVGEKGDNDHEQI